MARLKLTKSVGTYYMDNEDALKLIINILDAIETIKKRKKRPDEKSISYFIASKQGLNEGMVLETLEQLLDSGVLYTEMIKGSESYRINKEAETKIRAAGFEIKHMEPKQKANCLQSAADSPTPSTNKKAENSPGMYDDDEQRNFVATSNTKAADSPVIEISDGLEQRNLVAASNTKAADSPPVIEILDEHEQINFVAASNDTECHQNDQNAEENSFIADLGNENETLATFAAVGNMANSILDLNNLLKDEREVSSSLRLENLQLRSKVQELETKVNSQMNLRIANHGEGEVVIIEPKEIVTSKDAIIQPKEIAASKDVPRVTSHEQELEKQLKAVQIEKHSEYLLLKSNEKSCRETLGSDGIIEQKEKRSAVTIEQSSTTIDGTTELKVKRNTGTTKKGKNQNKQTKEKDINSGNQHSTATTTTSASESTAQQHHWPKGTVLIAGDSIISGINEKCFEGPNYVKVRSFPGATIADMKDYLKPLLRKNPTTLILHVGTNDASNGKENAEEILNELLELKKEIIRTLPSCKVIISMPTQRKDNVKANGKMKVLNQKIAALGVERINNNNIVEADLGRKKLYLNMKGSDKLAKNFTNYLRNL